MCWDCYNNDKGDPYKNFRHGGVEPDDFDNDVKYRHPKRKKKNKASQVKGCPENNNGSHVYVWVDEDEHPFHKVYGYSKYERQTCCGCGKTGKKRETERYEKVKARKYAALYGNGENQPRGEPVSRYRWRNRKNSGYKPSYWYWAWENDDPVYKEAYNKYIESLGFPSWRRI